MRLEVEPGRDVFLVEPPKAAWSIFWLGWAAGFISVFVLAWFVDLANGPDPIPAIPVRCSAPAIAAEKD